MKSLSNSDLIMNGYRYTVKHINGVYIYIYFEYFNNYHINAIDLNLFHYILKTHFLFYDNGNNASAIIINRTNKSNKRIQPYFVMQQRLSYGALIR